MPLSPTFSTSASRPGTGHSVQSRPGTAGSAYDDVRRDGFCGKAGDCGVCENRGVDAGDRFSGGEDLWQCVFTRLATMQGFESRPVEGTPSTEEINLSLDALSSAVKSAGLAPLPEFSSGDLTPSTIEHCAILRPVQGIAVHDSEVLAPEPVRQGGLMRKDARHVFRQPAKPLEPPTPRTSVLGLDRLAMERLREAAEARGEDGKRKRPRLDAGDEPKFKMPSLPASRSANIRQRGAETPSNPGGLSDIGRKRIEEYRRNREKQRVHEPKGLSDLQRRANAERDRR
ncbi:hypothetical protein HGRIS_011929 [Hohenbuehelia grisea]|uniref:Uncharacterized protein n=1 Tax=Hohenbuehelia grisea TaxID=104357 RepID=A0ABR3JWK0_9AGAR